MSFRELLQAIAMLVPTLLVVIAAAVSLGHSSDRPHATDESVAKAPPAYFRQARSSFNDEAENDEAQ